MNSLLRGQSGRNAGDDRYVHFASSWRYIPTEVLREFTLELMAQFRIRGVADMTGLAKDTVRKFAHGLSEPNLNTRKALGDLFLEMHPAGVLAENGRDRGHDRKWRLRPRLADLLPHGEPAARAALAAIFQHARGGKAAVPDESIGRIERWLELQVRGEYWAERNGAEIARRPSRRATAEAGGVGPRRRRRQREEWETDEDG
jgi:hypothetical protein